MKKKYYATIYIEMEKESHDDALKEAESIVDFLNDQFEVDNPDNLHAFSGDVEEET